ncbi:MAG: hypothetical protein AB7F53_08370, partial [Nitrososphaeraceae archaeon]
SNKPSSNKTSQSKLSANKKNISNKPSSNKTSQSKLSANKKNIILKRSSGRKEKFDTDRLAQTMSRSGVSFPLARDVAKSVTKKLKKSVQDKPTGSATKKIKQSSSSRTRKKAELNLKKEQQTVMVTADQIKDMVDAELKDRNQLDHVPSFSDTNQLDDSGMKISLNDREPVMDNIAANKNKILYDPSKQK